MLTLRPYQTDAIGRMRDLMRKGCRSILYTAPCGSGKTALTAHMLHTAAGKGMRSLFIVHRRELINQSTRAFALEGVNHGIIGAGFAEDRRHPVQLASVQTLARRLQRFGSPRLVVWDEAHHLASQSWGKIFKAFPDSFHIGLTATPERLDQRGLGAYFQEMVSGPSIAALTAQGYLAPYKLYAPSTVSLEGVHTRMGDYERHELAQAMDKPSITGNAIEHYKRLCAGRRAVVFCTSVKHSRNVVEQFISAGIKAAHVDGETPYEERDRTMEEFGAGAIKVLSNVDLIGEGFDCPSIEVAILLRPTQSLAVNLQQIGRALRPFAGKTLAVILDHVGNWQRHGLPDEDHNWTLEGHAGRARTADRFLSVKVCPSCFAAQLAGQPACKFCGHVFEVKPRKLNEKEGQLSEIDLQAARLRARKEQGRAESLEELTALGAERGYRHPRRWAYFVFKSRLARRQGKVL